MNFSEIITADKNICRNIESIAVNDRGFVSQNILAQLRTLVEIIAVAILAKNGQIVSSRNYEDIKEGLANIRVQGRYKNLRKFHELLQMSVSHYIVNEDSSERLMLKYYEYLLRLKSLVKKEFSLDILGSLDDFPLDLDPQLSEYYEKIAIKVDNFQGNIELGDRYYIHKIKPLFVDHKIYYEVSFIIATNNASKYERVIAFTNLEILPNYAVKLSIHREKIDVLNRKMDILIINGWEISIRPCEIENFSKIFNKKIAGNSQEDQGLMWWLKHEEINLVELINSTDFFYQKIKRHVVGLHESTQFFSVLDQCRFLVKNNRSGKNIIQYLLYNMNNKIIRNQYFSQENYKLKGLMLCNECIPFDDMPFATSPRGHNPRISDLLDCFNYVGREHELFANRITNNSEIERTLFSDIRNFEGEDINSWIRSFNFALYPKRTRQRKRALKLFKNHIYIESYVDDCIFILEKLSQLTNSGLSNYSNAIDNWLRSAHIYVDSDEKKEILKNLFINSHVALIYGAAGTGKSTLISHIAGYFHDKKKVFIANTHAAKSNLERKVNIDNSEYFTVMKYLKESIESEILFIDEASTISNQQMKEILEKAKFRLLVLVGDNYQIESIRFGNWFDIVKDFIPNDAVHELLNTYRTDRKSLLNLWGKVRELHPSILESLVVRETDSFSQNLDETIFDQTEDDQIILCLNYDGLYGINNVNRLLQESNKNKFIMWGVNIYKVGDPILFNESGKYPNIIHNNLKGMIVDFKEEGHRIWFFIDIDLVLDESKFWGSDPSEIQFINSMHDGKTTIKIAIDKIINTDEDDLYNKKTIPFQVSYAISIHKAQGLEYDSVKVVINNETDEAITHNIFYTAITRAKKQLKIYWSPESEKKILDSFKLGDNGKDIRFIKMFMQDNV